MIKEFVFLGLWIEAMNFSGVDFGPVKALIFGTSERVFSKEAMLVDDWSNEVGGHEVWGVFTDPTFTGAGPKRREQPHTHTGGRVRRFRGSAILGAHGIGRGNVGFVHVFLADNPFPRSISRARVAFDFLGEN